MQIIFRWFAAAILAASLPVIADSHLSAFPFVERHAGMKPESNVLPADVVTRHREAKPEKDAFADHVLFPQVRKRLSALLEAREAHLAAIAPEVSLDFDPATELATVTTLEKRQTPFTKPGQWLSGVWSALLMKPPAEERTVVEQFAMADAEGKTGVAADADTADLVPLSAPGEGREWVLALNKPVAQQLQDWAKEAGWKLHWSLPDPKLCGNAVTYRGTFDQAIEMVVSTLYPDGMPIRLALRDKTKKIEVSHVDK